MAHRGIAPLGWIELLRGSKNLNYLREKQTKTKAKERRECMFVFQKCALGAFRKNKESGV